MKAAVLIVTHNSEGHIGACLEALSREPRLSEILVVDNASTDRTVDEVRRIQHFSGTKPTQAPIRLVQNPVNRGFSGAVNQGFQTTGADTVLLLNPDALWDGHGLAALHEACIEHGLSTGILADAGGQPQHGFSIRALPSAAALIFESLGINRLFPGNPVNRRYRCLNMNFGIGQTVEQPAGAMLMIRKDVWEHLGGLDEQFHPVWFEDVDFCARAREAGYKIWFTPDARALHEGGHSVSQMQPARRMYAWYGSLLRYVVKHFGVAAFRLVCASVAIGCGLRATAVGVAGGLGSPKAIEESKLFWKMFQLAGQSLWSGSVNFPSSAATDLSSAPGAASATAAAVREA